MPGSWSQTDFPYLKDDAYEVTSPITRRYNCIAWAAGINDRRWDPDPYHQYYWPETVPREATVNAIVQVYTSLGYQLCFDGSLQKETEKVAIFGIKNADGTALPTHAALQLESGEWTSKIGDFEDIRHKTAEAVGGPLYGRVICFMSRSQAREK